VASLIDRATIRTRLPSNRRMTSISRPTRFSRNTVSCRMVGNPRPRAVKGLLYCREEIEAQYEEWLRSQTGKASENPEDAAGEAFSGEDVSAHILGVINYLKTSPDENMRDDFDRAISRLEELLANISDDFELVDKTLSDIEAFLDKALLTNSDKLHLNKLGKDISGQLKAYKAALEPDVYKKTFDMMLLKRLREDAGLPRLSLFYL